MVTWKRVFGVLTIVFLMFLAVAVLAGIYFYEFHVFKEIRICVGNGLPMVVEISCENSQDCINYFEEASATLEGVGGKMFNLEGYPPFFQKKLGEIIDSAVTCEDHCIIREVKGFDFGEDGLEGLASCEVGDTEVLIEVRGKEALEIYNYFNN